ncbi:hypothetical protein C0J52_08968 [Blattella germanica]|nr:hypothetical protein C0J52_08968 [Blattella germanica]
MGVRSGDRGGNSMGPLRPIQCPCRLSSRKTRKALIIRSSFMNITNRFMHLKLVRLIVSRFGGSVSNFRLH